MGDRARTCRGCGQPFPGSRDVMLVQGRPEHISCYDPAWDLEDTVAEGQPPIDSAEGSP